MTAATDPIPKSFETSPSDYLKGILFETGEDLAFAEAVMGEIQARSDELQVRDRSLIYLCLNELILQDERVFYRTDLPFIEEAVLLPNSPAFVIGGGSEMASQLNITDTLGVEILGMPDYDPSQFLFTPMLVRAMAPAHNGKS